MLLIIGVLVFSLEDWKAEKTEKLFGFEKVRC